MAIPLQPNERLTVKTLPAPLRQAIQTFFANAPRGCALVGGTALAGYYAGHRESDDMDVFTADARAQEFAVTAVKSLATLGTKFSDEMTTPAYYHCLAELDGHGFTIDIVRDPNLYRTGGFVTMPSGVTVADLETLLKMKIAALVRRGSEKDLYDLVWLTEHYRQPSMEEWLKLGQDIDAGATAEAMLASLLGQKPRATACGFAQKFGMNADKVMERIATFKTDLQKKLAIYLEQAPVDPAVAALIRKIKKLR